MKAKKISALSLTLADGDAAVFVQDGDAWNGLRKFACVSPHRLSGKSIIAINDSDCGPFTALFDEVFGRLVDMKIVMCSPDLVAEFRAAESEKAETAAA